MDKESCPGSWQLIEAIGNILLASQMLFFCYFLNLVISKVFQVGCGLEHPGTVGSVREHPNPSEVPAASASAVSASFSFHLFREGTPRNMAVPAHLCL